MSHSVISESAGPALIPNGAITVYHNAVSCAKYGPYYSNTYDTTPSTYKYRSASTNNPKDWKGWRRPAYYKAMTIETSNRFRDSRYWKISSNCQNAYEDSTIYQEPITSLNLGYMFSYPATLQRTPLRRNFGLPLYNMRNWSKARAVAKLNLSDFMLGVTMGEAGKTVKMAHMFIMDIVTFVKRVKRGEFRKLWPMIDRYDPVQAYLSWRYGWSQLWRDIWNAAELDEQLNDGTYERFHVYTKDTTSVQYYHSNEPAPVTQFTRESYVLGWESVKTRMDWYCTDPNYVSLYAIGLSPIPVIWELAPWSFVADWFLNLGTWLEAVTYKEGWTFLAGSQTSVGEYDEVAWLQPKSGYVVECPPVSNHLFEMERVVVGDPNVVLAINPQILQAKLGTTRLMDAIALMCQLVRKF